MQCTTLIKRNGALSRKALIIYFFLIQEKIYSTVKCFLQEFNNWNSTGESKKLTANHFDLSAGLLAIKSDVDWYKNFHVNPTFNENGTRLHFNFPLKKDKVVVSYMDL